MEENKEEEEKMKTRQFLNTALTSLKTNRCMNSSLKFSYPNLKRIQNEIIKNTVSKMVGTVLPVSITRYYQEDVLQTI